MTKSYFYKTCGLGIESTLDLPELYTADRIEPDVTIRVGNAGRSAAPTGDAEDYFDITSDRAFLFWPEVGAFLVRNGTEVIVEPQPDVEARLLRLPLLGPVLSAVISQRGCLGLHASAVMIGGQAVAFVGESGQGKSTLAATLYARGHAVLADDLVVVETNGTNGHTGTPVVLPSYPQLKLFPEAVTASLGDNPDDLPLLMTGLDKRARYAADGFSLRPVPLTRIYVLENDTSMKIEPVPGREQILHLIRQSYGARIFKYRLKGPAASAHFQKCAALAAKVQIWRLKRPHSLAALGEVAEMVENAVAENSLLGDRVAAHAVVDTLSA
jgi:hypothetical protein